MEHESMKLTPQTELLSLLRDGMSIMAGGFLGCGGPERLIDLVIESGTQHHTIICNDTAFVDKSVGRLIVSGCAEKVITSHIGTNPETGRLLHDGKLTVELVPQGTLIERIRAGGSGLGGVLTPTGIGTVVEEGKQKVTIEGKEYLLELPLRADLALIKGAICDTLGNVYYKATARNFNPIMALAADVVIVEADEIVAQGAIQPELVMTPCVLVDYILKEEAA
jgi:acetate CoA/acetoacetate CoA-transferase alpha subunit